MQLLTYQEIQEILPYRYPMMMIDRAVIESETRAVGLKNLTFNELFFQGHFPNHPIMPGVLQLEAMVQTAQLLVQDKLDPERKADLYLKRMDRVKFRKPNNPGDRVKIEANLEKLDNGEAVFQCRTSNSAGVTCQAKITLALRPFSRPETFPELNEFDKTANIHRDVNGIMSHVPHRYPFLLIDNIITATDDGHIVATKNISANEEIFQGYKPGYPVLPGSLQAEIVAQAGCSYVLAKPENKGKLAYFMGIDEAEYFHPIFPGDQLICDVSLPPVKSRFGKGAGEIRVGNTVAAKVSMTFAVIDPE
ncbi:MAG: 3-hydroxyacyl-ACP dehydratase FabZ [Victivallales bacterium]|nr:3-hydroxyacyl-ACP dehydratase FabZ [Victivallales bacterium]